MPAYCVSGYRKWIWCNSTVHKHCYDRIALQVVCFNFTLRQEDMSQTMALLVLDRIESKKETSRHAPWSQYSMEVQPSKRKPSNLRRVWTAGTQLMAKGVLLMRCHDAHEAMCYVRGVVFAHFWASSLTSYTNLQSLHARHWYQSSAAAECDA
jgi:hypothetical protein